MNSLKVMTILAVALTTGCLKDLRPNDAPMDPSAVQRGRALLNRAAELQGTAALADAETYQVKGRDHWKGLFGKAGNPWPEHEVRLQMRFAYGGFDSQAKFIGGKHDGEVWGMQAHRTYVETAEGRTFEKNNDQAFVLAAYHYFFEFPERIRRVSVVRWTGTQTIGGREYDVVYASWGEEPTSDYDQYIVYVSKESGLIEKTYYTLRDMAGFLTGTMHFSDFRKVGTTAFPFRQTVTDKVDADLNGYMHEFTVEAIEVGTFRPEELVVDPDLPVLGDVK